MTAQAIKKQLDVFVPLLTIKQQELLLDMVKNILHVEPSKNHTTIKQYNKEIEEAEQRIAKGKFKTHAQAIKELSKW